MKYFDTRTGALVDDTEARWDIENRLANRYPIVPVEGRVLEIIEKGREACGIEDNVLGNISAVHDRPLAQESPEEAKENLDAELERQRAAQVDNSIIQGGASPAPGAELPDGSEGANSPARDAEPTPADEATAEAQRQAAEEQAQGERTSADAPVEDERVKARGDDQTEAEPTDKPVDTPAADRRQPKGAS